MPRADEIASLFARCCALLRQRDQRAAAMLPLLEAHPGYAPGWLELARTLRACGHPAAAVVAAERSVAADATLAPAWFVLGLLRQDQHEHAAAASAYRAALEAAPTLHEAALNLGVALQEGGQLEAALDAYAACYRLHPASFGRIAQAVVAAPVGRLWLDIEAFRVALVARA